jgi:lysylphosphatidylglycerol synthetase-like protein (DUF2156 family)
MATLSVGSTRPIRSEFLPRISLGSPRVLEIYEKESSLMLLVLALLLVLIVFGAGFAVHLLWIAALVLLVLWIVGFAIGRGEGAGSHRFYRW